MPNLVVVAKIAGSFIAFLIGSGFATGQEILQFFVAHGVWGIGGCLVFLVLSTWLSISLLLAGQRFGLHNSDEVFRHYAGPQLGAVFAWYTVIVLYCVYVVMLAGAGAVLREQLGTPIPVGAAAMSVAVFLALFLGLRELVDVIGSIGPLLVLLVMAVAIAALAGDHSAVWAGDAAVRSVSMLRAADSWWMAGIVYTALCSTGLAGLLPPLGATLGTRHDLVVAGAAGPLLFTLALSLCTLALLGAMPGVQGTLIPMLQLAEDSLPILAPVFGWIVLLGIFTTAAPLLWIVLVKFAADGSPRYRALSAALSVLGLVCGIALPFDRLLNIVYPTIGYSGVLFLGCVLYRQVRKA